MASGAGPRVRARFVHAPRYRCAVVLVLVGLLMVGGMGWKIERLMRDAVHVRASESEVEALLEALAQDPGVPLDPAQLGTQMRTLHEDVVRLRDEVGPHAALCQAARALPEWAQWPADAIDILDAAVSLSEAGANVDAVLEKEELSDGSGTNLERLLAVTAGLEPRIPQLVDELDTAAVLLGRVDNHPLGGPLQPWQNMVEGLATRLPGARSALEIAGSLGPELGSDR